MMEPIQKPKAETRRPKEGRIPKSESARPERYSRAESKVPFWGEEMDGHYLTLRENEKEAAAARPLNERKALFGVAIIRFAKRIPQTPVNERLISQLVRAGTGVGANYCEADDSVSGKEFKQKIGTCRKEFKETLFFLRLIPTAEPRLAPDARILWREAQRAQSHLRRHLEKVAMFPSPGLLTQPGGPAYVGSAFGFRPPAFFRPSGFGLRISPP